ncbi:Regulator of protease activity HflC, stomatin/prohibitin superfamily [Streptomyces yunnanensis]|uniref:Regulator of protease activity HflC, stomatin/prohibitin superfamily n=1 Tax=Streptomyces yunnanensis TaxID=156453 RepID=A0A9X8MPW6_9ACTN|nr:Regulator of protease activity HflC, stomatin/prohibitin superfamily [Streptomyces yunnanensis]
MEPLIIILAVVVALTSITLARTVRVIPQASVAIVERLGRYARTLNPGVHIVAPFIDSVVKRIDLREQVVPFPPQPVATRDHVVVNVDLLLCYQVTDPRAATYEVTSYIQAIEQLIATTLRSTIGGMDLERALVSREEINAALRRALGEATGKWGCRVNRIQLKGMEPPTSIHDSLKRRMRADRDKRVPALEAERVRESEALRPDAEEPDAEKRAGSIQAEVERDVTGIVPVGTESARTAPLSHPQTDVPPARQPLREDDPRRIDRYRLTARLGQGGMGTVYLGHSPGEHLVAVKVIQRELAADPTFRQRFAREITAARTVGGSHTAPVVDADPHGDPPWLATEYIPGPSLHDVLSQYGALPVKTLQALAIGVAEVLAKIHQLGIVHRDLKPGNIILSATGPRVIDFGIARALDDTAITRTDHVVGTRGFLAPEQLTGAPVTFATDLYAFGMVLCHAAGAVPAVGEPLDSALGLLPSRLADIVTRCLDHDPAGRPKPAEVIAQLADHHHPSGEDWLPPLVRTLIDLHKDPTDATS